ncbi:hypothetical protein GGR26_003391 [Lewinella marina]|nr:DUF3293 domain-containing protein [Neolewinella marina]NJB87607.1 hypothetical protein [Neolewinella marina]
MKAPDEKLAQAYRNAVYVVNGYELKIDEPHPDFDAWLSRRGHRYYLILTAFNPYSTPLPEPVNEARHHTLIELLDRRGMPYVAAAGSDPEGGWPEERGVCLLDPSPEAGCAIGRLYQQHAIVVGRRGESPDLVWL